MSSDLTIDPAKPPQRKRWYYACVRCGRINNEFNAFGVGSIDNPKYYCRSNRCMPLRSRLQLWWQERRNP